MLPLGDENPTRLKPIVNWTIIAASILTFIWQTSGGETHFVLTLFNYGLVPARITSGSGLHTFITSIFLHGGWSHLLGNMLFLIIFGDNIEDNIVCRSNSRIIGSLNYLLFYVVCGFAASLFHIFTTWDSNIPAVGASGAIAGVLGAYFIFYPNRMVRTIVGLGIFIRVVRVKAYYMIGFWFVFQFIMFLSPFDTGVAFSAHIGGFMMGLLLAMIFRPRQRVVQTYYSPDLDHYR
jgi:membrane associated rhomboid family serine protease